MKERDVIAAVAERFIRCPGQRNERFASDAEIIDLGGSTWAVTVDDFSSEDRLARDDPAALGWNLAAATLSDLLAVGARPHFMLNSLVAAPWMDASFLRSLSAGIQDALTACGACMLGGDVGSGPDWRFTGVAIGSIRPEQAPLSRVATGAAGLVLVSGLFGDANLCAAGAGPSPRFELRLAESVALAAAAACIDTSDGLVSALETLCSCDSGLRIEIDLSAIPYAPGVARAAAAMDVPPEVFAMGSAGEYELVALVPRAAAPSVEAAGMRRIGSYERASTERPEEHETPGLSFRRGKRLVRHPGLPDPREAASFDEYRAALVSLARSLFSAQRTPRAAGNG